MAERKLVGFLQIDSAQILILEPGNLGSEGEYQRVVDVTLDQGAGEVRLRDDDLKTASDGVAVGLGSDGEFPVYVEYGDHDLPVKIEIDLLWEPPPDQQT